MNALKKTATPAVVSFAVALAIASVVLLISGHNPLTAYSKMWQNVASVNGLVASLNGASRLYVGAMAVAIGFKMNLFNIGVNGQYTLAALMAAVVGAAIRVPAPIHQLIILLVAMSVGALWALIAAWLKTSRNVNEVVSTIMLNGIVANGLIAYLLQSNWTHFRDPTLEQYGQTRKIPPSGRLPVIAMGGNNLWTFVFIAAAVGVGFYVLIYRTRFGYELRASGASATAARSAGVDPKRMVILTMLLSGGTAGLIGMGDLMSSSKELAYGDRFPSQLGFTAIGIALLGRNHPAGVAVAAFIWAAIDQGSFALNNVGIPSEIGKILLGVLLMTAVIVYAIWERRSLAAMIREAAARTAAARADLSTALAEGNGGTR